jgi:hypothetical protein
MDPPAKHYKNRVLAALPIAEIGRLRPQRLRFPFPWERLGLGIVPFAKR